MFLINKKFDFLLKFKSDFNGNLSLFIFNKENQLISQELVDKIVGIYNQSHEVNHAQTAKISHINLLKNIEELASIKNMLKAFATVKQRYKTSSLLICSTPFCHYLSDELLNNYKSEHKILDTKKVSFKLLKFFTKIFRKHSFNKKSLENIFYFNNLNEIETALRINNKFHWIKFQHLILIYLDFFLEELKRNGLDIDNYFVIVPQNVTFQILDLLKLYNVKYHFYDSNKSYQLLKDPKCLFAYADNYVIANPRYSANFNNYYFLLCLIWMLNSYTNRNKLLTFKYKKINETFGSIKYKKVFYKYKFSELDNLVKTFSNNYNKTKKYKKAFQIINVYKQWSKDKYMLFKLITYNRHQVIAYYDDTKDKLVFEYQLCDEYQFKSYNTFFAFIKMHLLVKKLLKKSRKNQDSTNI